MTEQPYRIYLRRVAFGYVIIENAKSEEDAVRQYEDGNFDEVYLEEGYAWYSDWENPRLEDVFPENEIQLAKHLTICNSYGIIQLLQNK